MPTPVVVDLSHHNVIPESLQPAADAGIVGIIHKVTEGISVIDDKLKARRALAADAGMRFGVYHFVRPGSIVEQAAFFVDTALNAQISAQDADDWLWALDYEDAGVSLDDVLAFLEHLENFCDAPVLYSGHVLKDKLAGKPDYRLVDYRLWLAQYGPKTELPVGWDRYYLWQYTDQGSVPGIQPPTDLNAYSGSIPDLIASWSGSTAPAPGPEPIEITITIDSPVPVKVTVV
jgi:lysozyme